MKRVAGFVSSPEVTSKSRRLLSSSGSAASASTASPTTGDSKHQQPEGGSGEPPLYLQEGLFAVNKPLGWTSQQVVGRIRKVLEDDAKQRGVPDRRKKKRKPWMKVGHGGTLDPQATGVLVVGVGKGTKELQKYLTGSKGYRAGVELGFQTTTLDMDTNGEICERKPFDHVTSKSIEDILPKFRGSIMQTPPIFSALKKDGKKLYELGRKGQTAEDIEIEARQIQIYNLELLLQERIESGDDNDTDNNNNKKKEEALIFPPKFGLDVECGGGTYIRALVRDIGIALGTVATMISLERTKQGLFLPEHCLKEKEEDWTSDLIYQAISEGQKLLDSSDTDGIIPKEAEKEKKKVP